MWWTFLATQYGKLVLFSVQEYIGEHPYYEKRLKLERSATISLHKPSCDDEVKDENEQERDDEEEENKPDKQAEKIEGVYSFHN